MLENDLKVLAYREPAEYGTFLRQIGKAHPGAFIQRPGADFLTVEQDLSCRRLDDAGDHVERRGLAGTVGTEKSHDFSLLHGHGHFVDDFLLTIAFAQVLGGK